MTADDRPDNERDAGIWPRLRFWCRRAASGVTGLRLAVILGLALVWSLSTSIRELPGVVEEHGLWIWLVWSLGSEFACIVIICTTLAVPLALVGNLGPQRGLRRYAALALTIALLAPLAGLERIAWLAWHDDEPFQMVRPTLFVVFWFRYSELAALVTVIVEFNRYEARSLQEMHRSEVDRLALDREMDDARLQVLQAQIEPHFLFNTLANVRRLYQTDLARGRSMLNNLMRYLEVALPQMRASDSTIQRELSLAEAYLNVQQIRMGERLAFDFEVPDAMRALSLPPMMLLTLVENAIKHGLNPLPEGGGIGISARRDGQTVEVRVSDTGRGFHATSGGGTGLANIRARLSALFGDQASLTLEDNQPRGVVSTLRVPATRVAT